MSTIALAHTSLGNTTLGNTSLGRTTWETSAGGHRESRPRLRLTARGRAVLTFLVAAPLVIGAFLFAINGGGATASLEGSSTPFEYVTVEPGQTMWQLAEQVAPQSDPRDVMVQLVQFNQLSGTDIYAGQELAVPAGLR